MSENIDLLLPEGGEIPRQIAGQWVTEDAKWKIVFDESGVVDFVIHPVGPMLKPMNITEVPLKHGGKGAYRCGRWSVQYIPDSRELTLEVVVDYFKNVMGPSVIEGKMQETLTGFFNEDFTVWQVDWFNISEYKAVAPFSEEPMYIKTKEGEEFNRSLKFFKVQE